MITDRTRKILWTRAGDRCAICHCKLVQNPEHPGDREAVVADECHIVPKGEATTPRSGAIPDAGIHEYENLILLCATDHRLVDAQPKKYSVEALREIKRNHERWVSETLDWREGVPNDVWSKVLAAAAEIVAEYSVASTDDEQELLATLGAFALTMALLLDAPDLILFIRWAEGSTLSYRVAQGSVFFDSGPREDFDVGVEAFAMAKATEDISERVRILGERLEGGADGPIDSQQTLIDMVGLALLQVARKTACEDATLYRNGLPGDLDPELAFRVTREAVELGVGEPRAFAGAGDGFDTDASLDLTKIVRIKLFVETHGQVLAGESDERSPAVTAFLANFFTVAAILGSRPDDLAERGDLEESRAILAGFLRDRLFEGLLLLRAAAASPDDARLLAVAARHFDRHQTDHLTVSSPACVSAVREYAAEVGLDEDGERRLVGDLLAALDATLSTVQGIDDQEVEDLFLRIFLDGTQWWGRPRASDRIATLIGLAPVESGPTASPGG